MPSGIWHPRIRKGSRSHRAPSLVTQTGTFEEGGQNVTLVLTPKSNGDNGTTTLREKNTGVVFATTDWAGLVDGDNKQQQCENNPRKAQSVETLSMEVGSSTTRPTVQNSTALGNYTSQPMNEPTTYTKNGAEKKRSFLSFFGNSKKEQVLDNIIATQSKIEVDRNQDRPGDCAPKIFPTHTKTTKDRRRNKDSGRHVIISTLSQIEVEWKSVGGKQRKTDEFKTKGGMTADNELSEIIPPGIEKTSTHSKPTVDSTKGPSKSTQTESASTVASEENVDTSKIRQEIEIVSMESKIEVDWIRGEQVQSAVDSIRKAHSKEQSYPSSKAKINMSTQCKTEADCKQELLPKPSKETSIGVYNRVGRSKVENPFPALPKVEEMSPTRSRIDLSLKEDGNTRAVEKKNKVRKSQITDQAKEKSTMSKSDVEPKGALACSESASRADHKAKDKAFSAPIEEESIQILPKDNVDPSKGLSFLLKVLESAKGTQEIDQLTKIIATHSKIEADLKTELSREKAVQETDKSYRASRANIKTSSSKLHPRAEVVLQTQSKVEVGLNDVTKQMNEGSDWRKWFLQLISTFQSDTDSAKFDDLFQIISTHSKIELDWKEPPQQHDRTEKVGPKPHTTWGSGKKTSKLDPHVDAILSTESKIEVNLNEASTRADQSKKLNTGSESRKRLLKLKGMVEMGVEPLEIEKFSQIISTQSKIEVDWTMSKQKLDSGLSVDLNENTQLLLAGTVTPPEIASTMSKLEVGRDGALVDDKATDTRCLDEKSDGEVTLKKAVQSSAEHSLQEPSMATSEYRGQTDSKNKNTSGKGFKLEPYTIVVKKSDFQEDTYSNKNTCTEEHCSPKESRYKEEISSTLLLSLSSTSSPKAAIKIEPMEQESTEVSGSNELLVILGVVDSEFVEKSPQNTILDSQATQLMARQKLDIVSPVEEAQALQVLSSASFSKSSESSSGVASRINVVDDTRGEMDILQEFQQRKPLNSCTPRLRKLWNNTSLEKQEEWLATLNAAIKRARQQQATRDHIPEVEVAVAELNDQHQDHDEDASVSSLDLLWQWLMCRKLEAVPQHQRQIADGQGVFNNTEAEDLDMLVDILAADTAGASDEDATEFPVAPENGNPMSPKRTTTNADLRLVKTF